MPTEHCVPAASVGNTPFPEPATPKRKNVKQRISVVDGDSLLSLIAYLTLTSYATEQSNYAAISEASIEAASHRNVNCS